MMISSRGIAQGTFIGDVTIATQNDLDNFIQAGIKRYDVVDGDFFIDPVGPLSDFANVSLLSTITGELKIINYDGSQLEDPLSQFTNLSTLGALTLGESGNGNEWPGSFFGTSVSNSTLTGVTGNLDVTSSENNYVLSLPELVTIGGSLSIDNEPLIDDINLSKLTTVGQSAVFNNTGLGNFDNLGAVNSIGGSIVVLNNANLLRFENFGSNSNMEIDTLWVGGNIELETIADLKVTIAQALIINDNIALTSISTDVKLRRPFSFSESIPMVKVVNNTVLTSLNTIFDVSGENLLVDTFILASNPSLTSIGTQRSWIQDVISITDNAALTGLGRWTDVVNLSGYLTISGNSSLVRTENLSNLRTVAGDVIFSNNDAITLTSYFTGTSNLSGLTGFRNLRSANALYFEGNDAIESMSNFRSDLTLVDTLSVTNNISLADCTILPCQVTVRGGTVNTLNPAVAIFGNTGDCADKDALRNDADLDGRACIVAARALPIELLAFTGRLAEDHVALTWETATETDNSHFFVERSTNGFTFTAIGRVEGAGNSTEAIRYDYPDYDYPTGRVYYRLRQVDFDGTESVLETVAIVSEEVVTELQTYPNPVTAGTPVNIAIGKEWARDAIYVDVFSADGRRAYSLTFPAGDRLQVPTTGLGTGLHLLRISNGNRTETQRLVVR